MTTKKLKLKRWAATSLYVFAFGLIILSLMFVSRTLNSELEGETLSYVLKTIVKDEMPVISYTNDSIIKPYDSEEVKINKNFYDKSSDNETQENSLIFYENTYMPNTGILYESDSEFDIKAVLDGNVTDVKEDEILGTLVEITHSNDLITKYYSLKDVNVIIGSTIKQGDIIGKSGKNNISSDSENMLLFEVEKNGTNLNPENFYQMNIEDLVE